VANWLALAELGAANGERPGLALEQTEAATVWAALLDPQRLGLLFETGL